MIFPFIVLHSPTGAQSLEVEIIVHPLITQITVQDEKQHLSRQSIHKVALVHGRNFTTHHLFFLIFSTMFPKTCAA